MVDTGDSFQSLYESVIIHIAEAKQATTITTHKALAVQDLAEEICTSPWIVELSKKSRIFATSMIKYVLPNFSIHCIVRLSNVTCFHLAYTGGCPQVEVVTTEAKPGRGKVYSPSYGKVVSFLVQQFHIFEYNI